jgi:hypothetical protein
MLAAAAVFVINLDCDTGLLAGARMHMVRAQFAKYAFTMLCHHDST